MNSTETGAKPIAEPFLAIPGVDPKRPYAAPATGAPPTDGTTPAPSESLFDLMSSLQAPAGGRPFGASEASRAIGILENLVEDVRELGSMTAPEREALVEKLLNFATELPDTHEGYVTAAALLSAVAQGMEAQPDVAPALSAPTRRRLADLGLQLDMAAPGQLQALLQEADIIENRGGGPGADVDFAQGPLAEVADVWEGLESVMGPSFLAPRTPDQAREAIAEAWGAEPSETKDELLEWITAEGDQDPLFALILAIIGASEKNQEIAAKVLGDDIELKEQSLATVQHKLQKATKFLEMGMGLLESLHAMQDVVGRGWS